MTTKLPKLSDLPKMKVPKFLEGVRVTPKDFNKYEKALQNSTIVLEYMNENKHLTTAELQKMMMLELLSDGRLSVLRRIKGRYDKVRRLQEEFELTKYAGGMM